MPILGNGWEVHFVREGVQTRNAGISRIRTIGHYQIFHNGAPQAGTDMAGMFAEQKGTGDNNQSGVDNKRRVEAGRYPMATQDGIKYTTFNFADSIDRNRKPKPGIELLNTRVRTEILIHPSAFWLSSVGCINLCTDITDPTEPITYKSSRRRVISMIEDMKRFLGARFPAGNGFAIPDAHAVIDGEP